MLSIPLVTTFSGDGIKKAIKSFKQLESASDKVKFVLKSGAVAGAAAFAALGAAAYQAGQALVGFAKMAADDEKGQKQLALSIRASTKATDAQIASVEDWIDTTQRAVGVADDELRPAFGRLVRSTNDISKAQDILKVALDVSAATGKPLKVVTEALGKAYDGNVKALQRLGLGFSKADLQTTTYVRVQKKAKEGTDDLEKAQYKAVNTARSFDSVLGELQNRFGGAALDNANTFEGVMARFSITMDELKESLGQAVLPYLKKLAEYGIQIADAFGKGGVAGAMEELQFILKTLLYDENGALNAAGQNLNELINKVNFLIQALNSISTGISSNIGVKAVELFTGDITPTFGKISPIASSINPGTLRGIRGMNTGVNITVQAGIGDPVLIGRQVYNAVNQFERRNGGR